MTVTFSGHEAKDDTFGSLRGGGGTEGGGCKQGLLLQTYFLGEVLKTS